MRRASKEQRQERDAKIAKWRAEKLTWTVIAERLGITLDAAQRAHRMRKKAACTR